MGFISGICIFEFLTVSLKTVTLKIFNNRHNMDLPLPPPPDICIRTRQCRWSVLPNDIMAETGIHFFIFYFFFILWLLITDFLHNFMAIIVTHWSFKILLLLFLSSKIIIHQSQDIFMLHLLHLGFGRLMRLSEIELKYICVVLKWVSWWNNK